MSKQDGGPAFPLAADADWFQVGGMTLRDYFAGQALAGFNANHAVDYFDMDLVRRSYEIADAAIDYRKQGGNQ